MTVGLFRNALTTALLLTAPPILAGDENAKTWLDKMANALQSLNYEGTFVYSHGDKMETMEIVHAKDAEGERERLLSLTGEAREVVRENDILTCILPSSKSIFIEPRRTRVGFPTAIPISFSSEKLPDFYQFTVGGRARVAGMACRIVAIKPRDKYRFGYRLCVEEVSGMLLQSEMLDHAGATIEKFMFTRITLRDHIPRSRFEPVTDDDDFTLHRVEHDVPDGGEPDPLWRILRVPPGFELKSNVKRLMPESEAPIQHLILSDGLSSVSIFIAGPSSEQHAPQGVTRSGALHAYATSVEGHQVTVVGEVPVTTVRMIAQSVGYGAD